MANPFCAFDVSPDDERGRYFIKALTSDEAFADRIVFIAIEELIWFGNSIPVMIPFLSCIMNSDDADE